MRSVNLTPSSLWDREQAFISHKKRLNHIKSHRSTRLGNSPSATKNLIPPIQRAHIFIELEHSKAIQKDNEELLQRLSIISTRKSVFSANGEKLSPQRSLNFTSRKKEAERILYENFAFLKRITEKPSSVNIKKFDDDYEQSRKYKQTISRVHHIERTASLGKTCKLPPINEEFGSKAKTQEKFNSKKKSLSMNEKELRELAGKFKTFDATTTVKSEEGLNNNATNDGNKQKMNSKEVITKDDIDSLAKN
ncbi:unnamed protein product [Blepharisma stoltei]|uniref:Uncharacterized protein n=1 Tax=Blepharisma stoltei TaxID=1481888 RepID=A0AAU9JIY6_9CILI|nr:unnamed protein product [Blepharisma stoltei]